MSADAWRVCPQCKIRNQIKAAAVQRKADESYGKLPKDEYFALVRNIDDEVKDLNEHKETLREDYEIYIDEEGEFFISYRGSCQVCSFAHKFDHKRQLDLTTAA